MTIRTCGIDEIDYYCDEEISHLVSVLESGSEVDSLRPEFILPENHLYLRFSDTDCPSDHDAPTFQEVFRLIHWLEEGDNIEGILVHCAAGISLSAPGYGV